MNDTPATPTQYAQIEWDEQGRPYSRQYDDIYFSKEQSLEETRHVFIEQNDLRQRFAAMADGSCLVIGETGFGTGLNFFCAWQVFADCAPAGARLHFVSVEKYPLSPTDLQRALALWPELKPLADQLLTHYVAIHQGFQRIILGNGRVTLTLLIGWLGYSSRSDIFQSIWLLVARTPKAAPARSLRISTPRWSALLATNSLATRFIPSRSGVTSATLAARYRPGRRLRATLRWM